MAVTKILARNGGVDQAIQYALNGDKTEGHILTAHQNCDPGLEYRQMMDTNSDTILYLGGNEAPTHKVRT